MSSVNTRLNSLQIQYDAMHARTDADPKVMARYEQLINAQHQIAADEAERMIALNTPRVAPTGSIAAWVRDQGLKLAG